jgi:gamma-glutamylcyclotransferase (GGCT)/AIG2-like uncharacterized protein YtfP
MTVSLFVYGTLKRASPGGPHRLLRTARLLGRGSVRGVLYDLGRYPGLVRTTANGHRVFGELYALPDDAAQRMLHQLDEYEGGEFARRRMFVTLPNGRRRAAWAYVLRGRPPRSARHLDSGQYAPGRGAA